MAQIVGRAGQSLGRGHRPVRRPHRDVHFDDFDRLRQPFDVISEQKNVKMNANVEFLIGKNSQKQTCKHLSMIIRRKG